MRCLKPLVAAGLALLICSAAAAADYPPAIQTLVNKGVKVVKQFDAGGALTGYVVQVGSRYGIVYGLPDTNRVVVGRILDAQGNNVTAAQAKKYVPKPDFTHAWEKLSQSNWIATGAEDPETIIYEFMDPNCPYCHLFWLANQKYMEAGLQVRHIVVGMLSHSSLLKAAAILQADNPAAAYIKNEKNYRMDVPEAKAGGIEPAENPSQEVLAKLKANMKLMKALGVTGTPGIFYKGDDGEVHRIIGLPSLSSLPEIYDLPKQKITNPKLQKYK